MSNSNPVFVTGGTGLIGAHILSSLLEQGATVRALKRPGSDLATVRKVIGYYHQDPEAVFSRIHWVDGSLNDPGSLAKAIGNARQVYHSAGMVSFDPRDRKSLFQANTGGTAAIVDYCLNAGVGKLCYISSAATLGKPSGVDSVAEKIHEEMPWNPSGEESDYALSKFEAEKEVWKGVDKGLNCVILNPTIVIGPGDWARSSSKLFGTIWKGFPFYSAGSNAFVDVRDVARAALSLMDYSVSGERYVVMAENHAFKQVFDWIAEYLGKKKPSVPVSPLLGEIAWRADWLQSRIKGKGPEITRATLASARKQYFFSNEKIVRQLDFSFIPIEASIRETCRLFLQEH
ncbi:MAG: NAD-dependent epimerase/dehydratase family protein [Haliscomenobacter sp.]|nr:NAD-dependent epimerase/dehydratase family protein [Haliscomenobacter sp.]